MIIQDSIEIAERAVATLDELIARSKRAQAGGSHDDWMRREGYLQSIALLLDVEVKVVRLALQRGEL